jgi:SAM-dependent methyltransferase
MSMVEPYTRLAGVYDEIVVDPCFPFWAQWLDEQWSGDPEGVRRVLDLGCGTGLLDAELIGRGYVVTGTDASTAMLDRARALLGPDVPLLHQALPAIEVDGVFDAAISTFDALNYLAPADFAATISRLGALVRAGGWLVFDLHTDTMLELAAQNPAVAGEESGHRFTLTHEADIAGRTCASTIVVERDGASFTERHVQYFHSDALVRSSLREAGFIVERHCAEYTDAPADDQTVRATWVARREASVAS